MKNQRILTLLLAIIAIVCVGFVLNAARVVVLPLAIAWFISYIVAPIVKFLVSHRVPNGVAVLLVLLLLLGFFYLTGFFVQTRVMMFIRQYDSYARQLTQINADLLARFNIPDTYLSEFDWFRQLGRHLVALSGSFVNFLGNMGMVLIFLVFMLLGKPYTQQKINCAFPSEQAEKVTKVLAAITSQISRYLLIKLMISFITALLVWVALLTLDVDFPVTWAVLTFLLNFIPYVGSIIATIPPTLVALVKFYPNIWAAIVVGILLIVIQQTMGSFIEPKLAGAKLNLSPVVILLSLVFWGWLWGITGALLSVPIAAAIKICCENIDALKPVSVMMGSGKFLEDKKR